MRNYYNSLGFRNLSKSKTQITNTAIPRPMSSLSSTKSLWMVMLMLLAFIAGNQKMLAQSSANYAFATSTSGSLNDMAGSTQLVAAGLDAAASPVTNIGFDFYFMGNRFSQFSVQEDGILQLGSVAAGTNAYTLTGGTITSPRLSAFNADNRTGLTSGKIHYKVTGVAPNRVLTVEFLNMQLFYTSSAAAGVSTWQMKLYEGGNIEYVYGTMSASSIASGDRAPSIGFYNGAAAGNFVAVSYATHTASTTTYAANPLVAATGTIAALDSATDGSRRVYTFTPPNASPSNPTALTFTAITGSSMTVNWVDSSTDETFFSITRALDAGFTTGVVKTSVLSTTTAGSTTAYTSIQTGLLPSTLYYYKIIAGTEGGEPLTGLLGSQITNPPGTFTSIATGNWNVASTWDAGSVPTSFDSAVIAAGHTVSVNATGLSINNLSVTGTLDYTATPTTFTVGGNLNVASGGLVNVFNATTGKTLSVAGNITNDGIIDVSVGATTAGNLTLAGTAIQTVSGTGNFGTNNAIRNLTFANTNTAAASNIVWQINDIKVVNNLSMTGARVNLGTNKMTFGYNAAGGTLTAPVGTGFTSGKFSRYWTAAATGTAITAGTDPTNATSRYPFLSASGLNRAMYITKTNATGAVAGELAVTYNDAVGLTAVNVVDGAYTVTDRYNGSWSVSNEGTAISSSSYTLVLFANSGLATLNGNARIISATGVVGTHQNGTTTPGVQRITVSQTDLLAGPLYVGIGAADLAFASMTSGSWNQATTWNKGVVPTCNDNIIISATHTVTSNSAGNVSKTVVINAGGTLVQASGDLTVGCTLKNNQLLNNGTLTVSGGALNINGNFNNASTASVFNQSGGTINIDGNDAGIVANSVVEATPLFNSASTNVNLSGGTLVFVDPPAGLSATSSLTVNFTNGTSAPAALASSPLHTTQFGDGISADAGGNANGFRLNMWASTAYMSFGKIIINGASGTNRNVTSVYQLAANGDVEITSGSTLSLTSALIVGGNLNVNAGGTYLNVVVGTSVPGISAAKVASSTSSNLALVAVTTGQSITNNGTIANLAALPTANVVYFSVLNSSAAGVTLNSPLSVSGTVALGASGIVNTTATNLLSLGTDTAAGLLTGGSATAYINGPFARSFATRASAATYDLTTLFPVGKAGEYLPVHLAPTTTAAGVKLQAEAFNTNTGTVTTLNILGKKRWEVQTLSGAANLTNVFVRETATPILATDVLAQAPSAAGLYTMTIPTTSAAGMLTSTTAIDAADFTGFLSYSHPCIVPVEPTGLATQSFCSAGTVANLAATIVTGNTLVWYDAATGGNLLSSTTALTTATPYYAAQIAEGGCESATRFMVTVTLTTPTTPNFAEIGTICSTSTAPVLGTTSPNGVTGTWSPATVSTTTGGTYVFTPITGTCASTQSLTVAVTTPTTPNFAEIGTICSTSTAPVLATTSPNGVTGTWSPATVSTTTGGTYVFTPTTGTCASTQSLTVAVTTSVTPNFAQIGTICSNSTAPILGTTSPNGITGTWSPSTVSTTTGGTYVFTPTTGTCASTQSLTVAVTTSVTPNFAQIGTICSNSTAPVLGTTSPNGVTGTWSPATVSTTTGGTYVFTPTTGTCASTQSLTVAVTTAPSQPTGAASQYGATLADLVVTPTTVTWYASAADASSGTGALSPTMATVDNATYYAVQVSGSCRSAALAVTIDFDLSSPSFGLKALKIYPNPVRNILTVSYSENITAYKLYNTLGQQLMTKNVNANDTQIDMSSLPAGSYLLEVSAGGKSRMVKLLKN